MTTPPPPPPAKSELTPEELGTRIRTALSLLEDVNDALDRGAKVCACCGTARRANMDDYQASQAIEGMVQKLGKLYEKLYDGKWEGRFIVPIEQASTVRGT